MKNYLNRYLAGQSPLHPERLTLPSKEELDNAEAAFDRLVAECKSQASVAGKTRRRVVRLWLLAAAASIVLLFVFLPGQKQSPQETIVAQQTIVQYMPQPQPEAAAEVSQPEAVAEEESKEKPVTELSEDAPQPTEPIPTETVKVDRHFNSQYSLEFTSPKDEPSFIASTSYIVTHRSGLAGSNAPDDSHDDGLELYSAKDEDGIPEGWKDLKNWSNGQKGRRNLTKKERKQVAVLGAIAMKQWHVDISSMNTMRYGSRTVTSDFFLELRGDTLQSYLPYLGNAYTSTLASTVGLNFEEPVLSYKESKPTSNKFTQIDIDVRTREDSYRYAIEIYDNGQAYIRVQSVNRDPISYDGTIDTSNL